MTLRSPVELSCRSVFAGRTGHGSAESKLTFCKHTPPPVPRRLISKSGLVCLHNCAQLVGIQFGHHEYLLGHGSLAGHQFVAATDRRRYPQLQRLAAPANTTDHGRRDCLYPSFLCQTLQQWNQSINVRAVGDDDPAQIGNKPLDRRDPSQSGYAEDSSAWP